jgi:hypothetical protein
MSGSGWSSVYLHFRSKDIANIPFCRYTNLLLAIFIALHEDTIFKFTGKLLEARLEHISGVRNAEMVFCTCYGLGWHQYSDV